MSNPKLGSIFLRVSNLENSIHFYCEQLGFKLRDTENWNGVRQANLLAGDQIQLLTLIEVDNIQVLEAPLFNVVVSNLSDLHDVLATKGYKVTKPEKWSSERYHHIDFDVFDPDGHPINLIEIKPITLNPLK